MCDDERTDPPLRKGGKRRFDFGFAAGIQNIDLEARGRPGRGGTCGSII
jgi:hypothetical protein